ncbi:MAG: ATP-binding protein, partial [Candidatus Omnitrophica bacterium]|nr:ATP-binding protein [Candidatus Omnitrophota bacterium]
MGDVRILPPEIISKIAAGEVIERPASVVKELIENSLDAKASSIELHIKQAGKTLIQIKDNGSGIAPDDMNIIFHRHATSKIRKPDDLYSINSLGFRGEALYSICAISDIFLRSKMKNSEVGWEIHIRGSQKISLKPINMPIGTEIEIRELFFNTPARRKFLKSDSTEI